MPPESLLPTLKANTPLLNALLAERDKGRYRFHVPGHAGQPLDASLATLQSNLFALDWTELPDLDVLGDPQGVLKSSQEQASQWYDVSQTFYLINGASVGLMAILLALSDGKCSDVLLARNVHRAVIHGLVLTGMKPQWLLPQQHAEWGLWGAVCPSHLETYLLAHPEVKAFMMTHPTYEGLCSDVVAIASVCRRLGVILVVDEAHGALWPFHPRFPTSAVTCADAVVHSLHKSGGSLTQTALLHLPKSSRLNPQRVQQALNVLQTTSPSYPLLASLEATLAFWQSQPGQDKLTSHLELITAFRAACQDDLETIHLWHPLEGKEALQLLFHTPWQLGDAFGECLEETYGLSFESVTPYSALYLANPGLPEAALHSLLKALRQVDLENLTQQMASFPQSWFTLPESACSPRDAWLSPGEELPAQSALGRVARQVVAACPPGIPILFPGEYISLEHLPYLPESVQVLCNH